MRNMLGTMQDMSIHSKRKESENEMSIFRWFSVMKQSLVHKKKKSGKLCLCCSTIPPLHWDALGARRLPCKVSVWTAWHTTSSKWGIFLEVFFLICFSFGRRFGNNNPVSLRENLQLFLCSGNWVLYIFCNAFDSRIRIVKVAVPCGPFYQRSTTNRPIWHQSDPVLSSSLSQTTSAPENSSRAKKIFFFFSSKKIHEHLPPILFLSLLGSSTVSWLSHDLLLRMSLTLAKESGISAFCRGPP